MLRLHVYYYKGGLLTITREAIITDEVSFTTVAIEITNGVDTDLITSSVISITLKII